MVWEAVVVGGAAMSEKVMVIGRVVMVGKAVWHVYYLVYPTLVVVVALE